MSYLTINNKDENGQHIQSNHSLDLSPKILKTELIGFYSFPVMSVIFLVSIY